LINISSGGRDEIHHLSELDVLTLQDICDLIAVVLRVESLGAIFKLNVKKENTLAVFAKKIKE